MNIAARLAVGMLAAAAIALGARAMRALTWSGVIAAVLVGTLGFTFGGLTVALAIIIFFTSGSILSRLHSPAADKARAIATKGAKRDALQVLANGGVATVCALAGGLPLFGTTHSGGAWIAAAVCALAAASGDTWSSEIGAFSSSAPRYITNVRRLATPGTSGAITVLGTSAAPFGGSLVGLAGVTRPDIMTTGAWLAAAAVAGLVGSLVDSVLGATLQAQWRCEVCGYVGDAPRHGHCSGSAELCRGIAWFDNDAVNVAATVSGALIGFAAASTA